jgi:hypothetical protein
VITLDWFANYVDDDFAIVGLLLDESDCSQSPVVSATGDRVTSMAYREIANGVAGNSITVSSGVEEWQSAEISVPETRTDNSYRFVFVAGTFDKSGGRLAGATLYIDNISAGQTQSLNFAELSNRGLGESVAVTATTSSGLPATFSSTTPGVCSVDSESGALTMLAGGTCSITASQGGGTAGGVEFAAASSVTRSFVVEDTRLSDLTGSIVDLEDLFAANPNASNYAFTVPTLTSSINITASAISGAAVIDIDGVVVDSGEASEEILLTIGENVITLGVTVGDTVTTTVLTITRQAPQAPAAAAVAPTPARAAFSCVT